MAKPSKLSGHDLGRAAEAVSDLLREKGILSKKAIELRVFLTLGRDVPRQQYGELVNLVLKLNPKAKKNGSSYILKADQPRKGEQAKMAAKSSKKTGVVTKGPATTAERLAADAVRTELIARTNAGTFMSRAEMVAIAARSMGIPAERFPNSRWFTLCALVGCKGVGDGLYKHLPQEERLTNAVVATRLRHKLNAQARKAAEKRERGAKSLPSPSFSSEGNPDYIFEADDDGGMVVEVIGAKGKAKFKATAQKVLVYLLVPILIVACLFSTVLAHLPH